MTDSKSKTVKTQLWAPKGKNAEYTKKLHLKNTVLTYLLLIVIEILRSSPSCNGIFSYLMERGFIALYWQKYHDTTEMSNSEG